MGPFSLFRLLVVDALKADMKDAARRAGMRFALGLVSALLVLAAIGLAFAALTVWLSGLVGAVWALLIVAGGLVCIAALLGLISGQMTGRRRRVAPMPAMDTSASPAADQAGAFSGPLLSALAILAAAGILAARGAKGPAGAAADQDGQV